MPQQILQPEVLLTQFVDLMMQFSSLISMLIVSRQNVFELFEDANCERWDDLRSLLPEMFCGGL